LYQRGGWFEVIRQFLWLHYPEPIMDKNRIVAMVSSRILVGKKCFGNVEIAFLRCPVQFLKESQCRCEGKHTRSPLPASSPLEVTSNVRVACWGVIGTENTFQYQDGLLPL
jgi:hypothetical protein